MRPAVTRAVMQSIFWRSRKARLSDEWKCFQFINGNTKNLYQYWQRKKLLLAKPNIPELECKQLLINTTKERDHVMSLGNCRLASLRRCVEAFNYIFIFCHRHQMLDLNVSRRSRMIVVRCDHSECKYCAMTLKTALTVDRRFIIFAQKFFLFKVVARPQCGPLRVKYPYLTTIRPKRTSKPATSWSH